MGWGKILGILLVFLASLGQARYHFKTNGCSGNQTDELKHLMFEACSKVDRAYTTITDNFTAFKSENYNPAFHNGNRTSFFGVLFQSGNEKLYQGWLKKAREACTTGSDLFLKCEPQSQCSGDQGRVAYTIFQKRGYEIFREPYPVGPIHLCPLFWSGSQQVTDLVHEFGRKYGAIWGQEESNSTNIYVWDVIVDKLATYEPAAK